MFRDDDPVAEWNRIRSWLLNDRREYERVFDKRMPEELIWTEEDKEFLKEMLIAS